MRKQTSQIVTFPSLQKLDCLPPPSVVASAPPTPPQPGLCRRRLTPTPPSFPLFKILQRPTDAAAPPHPSAVSCRLCLRYPPLPSSAPPSLAKAQPPPPPRPLLRSLRLQPPQPLVAASAGRRRRERRRKRQRQPGGGGGGSRDEVKRLRRQRQLGGGSGSVDHGERHGVRQ